MLLIGDIITIAGVNAFVSDTISDVSVTDPIPSPQLDPPTISMTFGVNDAPTAGKEGKFLTSSHIKQRLERECEVLSYYLPDRVTVVANIFWLVYS